MPGCNHVAPAQTHLAFHRPAHAHGTTRDAVRGTVWKEGGTGDHQPPAPRWNSRWRHGASTVLTPFLRRVVHSLRLSASLAPDKNGRRGSPGAVRVCQELVALSFRQWSGGAYDAHVRAVDYKWPAASTRA